MCGCLCLLLILVFGSVTVRSNLYNVKRLLPKFLRRR